MSEQEKWLTDVLLNRGLGNVQNLYLIDVIKEFPDMDIEELERRTTTRHVRTGKHPSTIEDMIYYGGIWSRKHYMEKEGDGIKGHSHVHDHISFLVSGSVLAQVEGYKQREFHAPEWLVIPKNIEHQFVALEDDTLIYCIHSITEEQANKKRLVLINGEFVDAPPEVHGTFLEKENEIFSENNVVALEKE